MRSPMHCAAAAMMAMLPYCAQAAAPQDDAELELVVADAPQSSIATGRRQALRVVPAAVTVITARDIEAVGAVELDQVLEGVPGLHVSRYYQSYSATYGFRGILSGLNPQVLMLVNGVPINNAVVGNRGQAIGDYPLENVERVEVIRGPGSALYGANAFAGVINIVTKGADAPREAELGARVGSWGARSGWWQYSGAAGPFEAALYLADYRRDGDTPVIGQDLQGLLDPVFHSHLSRAPGAADLRQSGQNLAAELALGGWRLRTAYQRRRAGSGAGIAESLGPYISNTSRLTADLAYQKTNWVPDWDVSASVDYADIRQPRADGNPDPQIFPPGAFGNLFPDGVIGNPTWYERHVGVGVSGLYGGYAGHHLLLGAGHRLEDLYRVTEVKNFKVNTVPGGLPLLPLPAPIDAANDPALVWLLPAKRSVSYLYLQDEWTLAPDWTLTAGVRRDRYSDFGASTNPRLALVWDASYNVVVKALYGRAFRAPSFVEEYPGVNPTVQGNPRILPETIATTELVLAWQPAPQWQTNLTLFRYREKDVIEFVANPGQGSGATAQNTGDQTGKGFEFELSWQADRAVRLAGSYSVQRAAEGRAGQDPGLAPRRHLYARADWRPAPAWQAGATLNYVAGRMRQPGDARPPVPDYSTVDLSLRYARPEGGWELRLALRNLFDRDVREPSLAPGNLPYDLPMPGRAASVELRRGF